MSTLILKLKSKTIVTNPPPPPLPKGMSGETSETGTAPEAPQEESTGNII